MYTAHGYHIAGSDDNSTNNIVFTNCGGPGECAACTKEAYRHIINNTPAINEYHDDDTVPKVYAGLVKAGLTYPQAIVAVNEVTNMGILFRERI
jgi:hypothetical protein